MNPEQELVNVLKIAVDIIEHSRLIPPEEKEALLAFNKQSEDILQQHIQSKTLTSQGIKSLKNTLLVYWNETISIDTEIFWSQLQEAGIGYKRKDLLRAALQKGRFKNVHQGMVAAINLPAMIKAGVLQSRFTADELASLKNIVKEETDARATLLRQCLAKGEIPASKYLRFGDSMGYMGVCNLWNRFFSEEEVQQLIDIWSKFKK